jgi:uncharacterized protein YndB with AHSA1/START domain
MKLSCVASIQIQKNTTAVYEAIVDPQHMRKYFISEGSARLDTAAQILWAFPEFVGTFPVKPVQCIPNKEIQFIWDEGTIVTITLEAVAEENTIVKVIEGEKEQNEANIQWALRNTEGWANFLACLKAYLEYGINLRKGAFDFMKR